MLPFLEMAWESEDSSGGGRDTDKARVEEESSLLKMGS